MSTAELPVLDRDILALLERGTIIPATDADFSDRLLRRIDAALASPPAGGVEGMSETIARDGKGAAASLFGKSMPALIFAAGVVVGAIGHMTLGREAGTPPPRENNQSVVLDSHVATSRATYGVEPTTSLPMRAPSPVESEVGPLEVAASIPEPEPGSLANRRSHSANSGAQNRAALESSPIADQAVAQPNEPIIQQEDQLAAERLVLDKARAALTQGNLGVALRELGRHKASFADGLLVEEREVLWVQALVRGKRHEQARTRAALFEKRFPRSIFLPIIVQAIEASQGQD